MGMPDKKSIVERLKANSIYYKAITAIYGEAFGQIPTKSMPLWKKAIAEFEKHELICAILFKI